MKKENAHGRAKAGGLTASSPFLESANPGPVSAYLRYRVLRAREASIRPAAFRWDGSDA